MELSKAYLDAQIEEMKKQREQILANLNAISGGLHVLEQLRAQLDAPDAAQTPAAE